MSTFNIQNAFSCCLPPLDDDSSTRVNENLVCRELPLDCCAWDRKIYFHVVIVEGNFSSINLDPCEPSHVSVEVPGTYKKIQKADGTFELYPVVRCGIYINKEIFNDEFGNDVSRLFRARCIAHELIIVEKYSNELGVESGGFSVPQVGHIDARQEDAVLCPWKKIEEFLQTVEKEHGMTIHSNADFMRMLKTEAGLKYEKLWLNSCVGRETWIERTVIYLIWIDRATLDERVFKLVRTFCGLNQIADLGATDIKLHIKSRVPLFRALQSQFKAEILNNREEDAFIWYIVCRAIDKHWTNGITI